MLTNDVLKGSAAALTIKFSSAVLNFAMFALLSRHMDQPTFGALAIIFNAASFFAIVSLCGQEILIVRSWNEYCDAGRPALARGALTFGAQVVLVSALLTACVFAIAWSLWDPRASWQLILGASAYLMVQSLTQFSGQFSRVASGIVVGDAPREVLWRLIVVTMLGAHHLLGSKVGPSEFLFTTTAAMLVALAAQWSIVAPSISDAVRRCRPQRDIRRWINRSFKMWLAALCDTTAQYFEVVVVGLVLGPAGAGAYFVATRITNFFAMVSASIAAYATSRISTLFYANARYELQGMLCSLAIIGSVFIMGGLFAILVGGKLLLWAFGTSYVASYPELLVLAVGAAIVALSGPAAQVLLLTGHEGSYPRIMALTLFIRFALMAMLGPAFGLMGIVIAWSLSAVFLSAALTIASRRLVRLDPSLLSLWAAKTA
jgi:O-antigen/teichoic acid export membrane protein